MGNEVRKMKKLLSTISFIVGAYLCWNTLGRTIIDTALGCLLVVVIGGSSALLAYWCHRKEPNTEETGDHMFGDFAANAIIIGAILFSTNYYLPMKTENRKAVIQDISIKGKRKVKHYILQFEDNGQKENIYGGLSKYKYHKGDTITTTYQHGLLGMDVVAEIQ